MSYKTIKTLTTWQPFLFKGNFIFFSSPCVGHRRLSCGTLICLLWVGISFKTYICSTDTFEILTELPYRQRTYLGTTKCFDTLNTYTIRPHCEGGDSSLFTTQFYNTMQFHNHNALCNYINQILTPSTVALINVGVGYRPLHLTLGSCGTVLQLACNTVAVYLKHFSL